MRPVSHTAEWTAAARAVESEREDALFHDALARELAGPNGFELLDHYQGGGIAEFVAIRTHCLDAAIRTAWQQTSIRQFVFPACGLDTRSFRIDWPDDAIVFEMDHPDLLLAKQERVDKLSVSPRVTRHTVGTDLTGDWGVDLLNTSFDPSKPTLWVPEGLLFYLEAASVNSFLRGMADLSAPGSRLATDIMGEWTIRNPLARNFMTTMERDGTAWCFGTDEPEQLLRDNGWDPLQVLQPGEPDAGEARWPYRVFPRSVPYIPRHFVVTAQKL